METFIEFLIGLTVVVGVIGIPLVIGFMMEDFTEVPEPDIFELWATGAGVILIIGLVFSLMVGIGKVALHIF